jgi:hypothetical protein
MLISKYWRHTCSLKIFCAYFIMLILGTLNISCSSGKKEIRSEQNSASNSALLPISQEKTADKDGVSSSASLSSASTVNDTVIGILYVTGNEPFTMLMLSDSQGVRYHVEADSSLKYYLWQLQSKRVGVIGMKESNSTGIRINVSSYCIDP